MWRFSETELPKSGPQRAQFVLARPLFRPGGSPGPLGKLAQSFLVISDRHRSLRPFEIDFCPKMCENDQKQAIPKYLC